MQDTSNALPRRARVSPYGPGYLLCWEDGETEPSNHGSVHAAEEWAKRVERYHERPEPEVTKPE